MLPLFAAILFALVGIAALCIDLGAASVAQVRLESAAEEAALERLRLAHDPEALAQRLDALRDGVAGGSESAEAVSIAPDGFARVLPLAFARGSSLRAPTELALSGRARSRLRTALRVGPAASAGSPGRAPFALSRATWIALHGPAAVAARDPLGFVRASFSDGVVRFPDLGADDAGIALDAGVNPLAAAELGDAVSASRSLAPLRPGAVYVPIAESIDGAQRVIGFGKVELVVDGAAAARLRLDPNPVAIINATAALAHASRLATASPALLRSLAEARAEAERAGGRFLLVATRAP